MLALTMLSLYLLQILKVVNKEKLDNGWDKIIIWEPVDSGLQLLKNDKRHK